jgi:hypothetical protein
VPARLAGTITGVLNMGNMSGVTVLQPAVGWVLDRRWDGAVGDGVRTYGLEAYQSGFSLMMGWIVLGLLLFCLTRETHCRPLD